MTTTLITGGTILTATAGTHGSPVRLEASSADLLVENGVIAELPTSQGHADLVIDASGMLVIPGLVQAHIHLCQTLFRGLADDLDVVEWLRTAVWPAEQAHDEASLRASAELGAAELLTSGTTTALTIETAVGTEVALDAVERLGLRAVVGPALMDAVEPGTGIAAQSTDEALRTVTELVENWHGRADGRVQVAISPRGTYNATPELWRACVRLAAERGLRLHTHASENAGQANRLERAFGRRDAVALAEYGALGPSLVLAHGVWFDDRERAMIAASGAHICHCPSANLKLASGIAPVPDLLAAGINVALGADGAACNNTLDALAEMRLASLLHKPRYGPRAMPASRVFAMATLGGATALGLADRIGSLAEGMVADIVCVRIDRLHNMPAAGAPDPEALAATLVHTCRAEDVRAVLVGGSPVVLDGALRTADQTRIAAEAGVQRSLLLDRMQAAGVSPR